MLCYCRKYLSHVLSQRNLWWCFRFGGGEGGCYRQFSRLMLDTEANPLTLSHSHHPIGTATSWLRRCQRKILYHNICQAPSFQRYFFEIRWQNWCIISCSRVSVDHLWFHRDMQPIREEKLSPIQSIKEKWILDCWSFSCSLLRKTK